MKPAPSQAMNDHDEDDGAKMPMSQAIAASRKKAHAKIAPNKTAPAGLKRVGPNGSFPVGDPKHDALAIGGAKTSEAAGHITHGEAKHITAEAKADEKKHDVDGAKMSMSEAIAASREMASKAKSKK